MTAPVEIVRGIYDSWSRGDFSAGVELYDPDVVLVIRPEFPDAGEYRGPDEIARYMRDYFLAEFEGMRITGEEFIEAGDTVLVRVHQHAHGPASGVEVGMRYYQAWTLRRGSVVRIESIMERVDALETAGLRE